MKTCLQKFQREQLNDNKSIEEESDVFKNTFYELLSNLDLESKGYALSECRDFINEKLNDKQLTNRKLKKLLISHFGENICFTYPNDKTKSQMFFSANICPVEVVETVRSTNLIKLCAEKLKKECKNYDFDLNNTLYDASDIKISMQNFTNNHPMSWELFFNTLFDYRDKSEHINPLLHIVDNWQQNI